MKKWLVLSMIAALASASFAAENQVTPSLKEGTQEIVVSGMYDPNSLEGAATAAGLTYGYFIMDSLEIGAGVAYADAEAVGTSIDANAFVEYNFDLGTPLVPFLGAKVGYQYLDYERVDTDSAVAGTASAGIKYFLADNVAIRAAMNGSIASEDVYSDDDGTVSDTDFNLTLGMAFYIP
jgi:opacity protein-like surface antigen